MSKKVVQSNGPRAQLLLDWYRRYRRDLPWRRTRDPYAIWVSEIMLQQTQVAKVVPYFATFMTRFPSFEDLAKAPIDEVLALWSGLGYYRRVRFLHRAARVLVAEGGEIPKSAALLQKLPGIGAYTAAAVASIAFGEVVPVLDGNVERVISRLLALREDPKRGEIKRLLLAEAAKLLDPEEPGDSNQALMELGATICRPRSPACVICPLAGACLGRERAEDYPLARKRRAMESVSLHVALVYRESSRLFFRRSAKAELMAGMWELPNIEIAGEKPLSRDLAETKLGDRYGGSWRLQDAVASVRHGITYRSITAFIHPAELTTESRVDSGPEASWVSPELMGDYAMSSLVAKILEAAS